MNLFFTKSIFGTVIVVSLQLLQTLAGVVDDNKGSLQIQNISLDATSRLYCPSSWLDDSTVTVTESGTHVLSANNPANDDARIPCKINFQRPSKDICQVRLDFVYFNMTGPNEYGDCDRASLTVTADNLHDFIACGTNTGQHLYLDYGDCDIVSVSISPNYNNDPAPVFDLQATFINCEQSGSDNSIHNDPAPAGCDQYYTNPSGQVRSFNYISTTVEGQRQINNQKYTICMKTLSGYKRIVWAPCSGEAVPFSITGYPKDLTKTGSDCQTDWIEIPGSPAGRYCGGRFPSGISSLARPFQMYVNFNNEEIPFSDTIDPLVGCPVGFHCLDQYGTEILPGAGSPPNDASAVLPCGSEAATALGQQCALNPGLMDLVDVDNTGFCLQYVLMN